MGIQAKYQKYRLHFKFNAGTSRGVLTEKDTYLIKIWHKEEPQKFGVGECSMLKGLSIDDREDYEQHLAEVCAETENIAFDSEARAKIMKIIGNQYPSMLFGFEMAFKDLQQGGRRILFPGSFTDGIMGIPVNGLIWMGNEDFMRKQIDDKLKQGYTCLKLKIGAIDFAKECTLLEYIRKNYSQEQIVLRVDANGAFSPEEALQKLNTLAQFGLHSIEQPIKQGQIQEMRELCRRTPLPIALDEELIGIMSYTDKKDLLEHIQPQYIILKPSLVGGIAHSLEWITLCEQLQIGWWITSALESNIGLNAISQFTATLTNPFPQGLGTGQLYTNNIDSPLTIRQGNLYYLPSQSWHLQVLSS